MSYVEIGVVFLGLLLGAVLVWEMLDLPGRRSRRHMETLSSGLGLRRSSVNPAMIEGEWQYGRVQVWYQEGNLLAQTNGAPSFNRLHFAFFPAEPLPIKGSIDVRRQNWLYRLATQIGLTRQIWRSGHAGSDDLFVEADDDCHAEAVVGDADFR